MNLVKTTPIRWNLAGIWNEVAFKENRELRNRDYAYASELGQPFYDRYLKMKAIPYTNPPNTRSLRKFLAGNIWEYTTKQILIACGVYRKEEIKIDATPYTDCISIHGRCDFISGGYIDGELAAMNVSTLNLPDFLFTIAGKIIASLEGKLLEEKILELKAVSTFAMDKVERMRAAIPSHTLQGYHYQKNGNIDADVCYICKDDCRMAQYPTNAEIVEPIYRKDLEQITFYYTKGIEPPKEPLAKFDETLGKFSKNLGVEYSCYLSHYGFANPDEYRQSVSYIDKWNRCLSRYVQCETGGRTPTGKPMILSSKNKEGRTEIEAAGYDFNSLMECKIRLGATEEEEEVIE